MFSSTPGTRSSLKERVWGIVLGSLLTLTVATALISARTIPFLYAATTIAFLGAGLRRGKLKVIPPGFGLVAANLGLFLAYALVSCLWAISPKVTLAQVSLVLLITLAAFVLISLLDAEDDDNLLHMGEGVWIGFVVALIYVLIESASDQSIKLWLYNSLGLTPASLEPRRYFTWEGGRLLAISREDLTRSTTPITPFLWPIVLIVRGMLAKRWSNLAAFSVAALASVVVIISPHATSKIALVCGAAAFVGALYSVKLIGRLAVIGWIFACIAVLPAALLAHRLNVHNISWLERTARERIVIWNHTAQQTLNAPILGRGADMTYVLGPMLDPTTVAAADEQFTRRLSIHAHNVFLQTWFELGLVGATLLTLAGLALLRAIGSIRPNLQPYAYATFASATVVAASSYGMWQNWFVAMFAQTAVLFALGRLLSRERSPVGAIPD